MADNYMISRADLLRLVALLQRRSVGVKYAGNRLRVTEASTGSYVVNDFTFRPVGRVVDGK